jgi:hypothetical protein
VDRSGLARAERRRSQSWFQPPLGGQGVYSGADGAGNPLLLLRRETDVVESQPEHGRQLVAESVSLPGVPLGDPSQ